MKTTSLVVHAAVDMSVNVSVRIDHRDDKQFYSVKQMTIRCQFFLFFLFFLFPPSILLLLLITIILSAAV